MKKRGTSKKTVKPVSEEKFMCFTVADEMFAITLLQVQGVMGPQGLSRVVSDESVPLGFLRNQDQLIPVFDLQTLLKRPSSNQKLRRPRPVIIVKSDNEFFGLIVDDLICVTNFENALSLDMVGEKVNLDGNFISGAVRGEAGPIFILDLQVVWDRVHGQLPLIEEKAPSERWSGE